MSSLVGFVQTMATHLDTIDDVRNEFRCLLKILECQTAIPAEVIQSVEMVRGAAASSDFRFLRLNCGFRFVLNVMYLCQTVFGESSQG